MLATIDLTSLGHQFFSAAWSLYWYSWLLFWTSLFEYFRSVPELTFSGRFSRCCSSFDTAFNGTVTKKTFEEFAGLRMSCWISRYIFEYILLEFWSIAQQMNFWNYIITHRIHTFREVYKSQHRTLWYTTRDLLLCWVYTIHYCLRSGDNW